MPQLNQFPQVGGTPSATPAAPSFLQPSEDKPAAPPALIEPSIEAGMPAFYQYLIEEMQASLDKVCAFGLS
jgi:hypothetical protein